MGKFQKGFFVGAATVPNQVEGNNIYSDCWSQGIEYFYFSRTKFRCG